MSRIALSMIYISSVMLRTNRKYSDRFFYASSSDKTYSTKEPRLEQTSCLLCRTSPAIRCRCGPTAIDTLPPPDRHKLKSCHVSWSTPPPGSASSSPWTHLFTTHISSVFPLLTPSVSQPVSELQEERPLIWSRSDIRQHSLFSTNQQYVLNLTRRGVEPWEIKDYVVIKGDIKSKSVKGRQDILRDVMLFDFVQVLSKVCNLWSKMHNGLILVVVYFAAIQIQ